jgi:hypothetical protein
MFAAAGSAFVVPSKNYPLPFYTLTVLRLKAGNSKNFLNLENTHLMKNENITAKMSVETQGQKKKIEEQIKGREALYK